MMMRNGDIERRFTFEVTHIESRSRPQQSIDNLDRIDAHCEVKRCFTILVGNVRVEPRLNQ